MTWPASRQCDLDACAPPPRWQAHPESEHAGWRLAHGGGPAAAEAAGRRTPSAHLCPAASRPHATLHTRWAASALGSFLGVVLVLFPRGAGLVLSQCERRDSAQPSLTAQVLGPRHPRPGCSTHLWGLGPLREPPALWEVPQTLPQHHRSCLFRRRQPTPSRQKSPVPWPAPAPTEASVGLTSPPATPRPLGDLGMGFPRRAQSTPAPTFRAAVSRARGHHGGAAPVPRPSPRVHGGSQALFWGAGGPAGLLSLPKLVSGLLPSARPPGTAGTMSPLPAARVLCFWGVQGGAQGQGSASHEEPLPGYQERRRCCCCCAGQHFTLALTTARRP